MKNSVLAERALCDFADLNARMPTRNKKAAAAAQARLDSLAKPVGSLGELETLLVRIAGISGTVDLGKRVVFVLAADNGVTAQGVTSIPPEITATMASFMAERRSAVCIMAAQAGVDVCLVDMGMFRTLDAVGTIDATDTIDAMGKRDKPSAFGVPGTCDIPGTLDATDTLDATGSLDAMSTRDKSSTLNTPGILNRHIADGTADMSVGPAMTREQAEQAIFAGIELACDAAEQGYRLIATGEMGIGNTTTSSALAAVLLGREVAEVTGRGAGLSDEGLNRKIEVIRQAIQINDPRPDDAFDVLSKLGGFDIAGMCGLMLGGALSGVPVIIDGFISAVAALVAVRLCPRAVHALIPSHISAEPGAILVLEALGLAPIIHANMRLGEGTGAVALIPLLDMAAAVYHELMTFDDIGM